MDVLAKLLIVFGLGTVELWAAIPTGLALQLHPYAVCIATALGALLGLVVILILGERVRTWLLQRYSRGGKDGQHGLIHRIWMRYGILGLGLFAPLLVGIPLGAAIGIALGAPVKRLLIWMSMGIILWSVLLTLAGTLGLPGIEMLKH